MKSGISRVIAVLFCIALMGNITAAAQQVKLYGLDSGAVQKSNERQLKDQLKQKQETQNINTQVNKETILDAKKDIKVGSYIYNPQFELKKIVLDGNFLFSDTELLKLADNLIGKKVYMEDVLNLTVDISRFYQKKGYLTCHAFIPPQEVSNGQIKIQIIESKIAKVNIQGNKWASTKYLENTILGSNNLENGKVFNARKLQAAMKELKKQDYIQGEIRINKSEAEDTIITLNVKDRIPLSFDVVWDNYGRELTGRQRANLILSYENLTGHGDKLYGGTILAKGTQGALAGYEIPVGKHGTKLGFDYSFSNIKLGKQYKNDNITGYSHNYSFRITQPLYRDVDTEVVFTTSLDAIRAKTKYNSQNSILSNYSLRVFRTNFDAMHDDAHGRWIGNIGADFGARFLGSTTPGWGAPESDFYKFRGEATRVHLLPKRSLAIVRVGGQYSPNRLFAAEQMQLGGPYSLRGYEPGVILGDWGVTGTAELRTPFPYLRAFLPKKIEHWEEKIKLTAFYDWGYTKEHDNLYAYPRNFLHNIGTGIHCYLTDNTSAAFNIGMPLGGKHYQESAVRFNFSLNSEVDRIFLKPAERL